MAQLPPTPKTAAMRNDSLNRAPIGKRTATLERLAQLVCWHPARMAGNDHWKGTMAHHTTCSPSSTLHDHLS